MTAYTIPAKVRLVYFTGTGGTRLAAIGLSDALKKCGVTVFMHELSVHTPPDKNEPVDLLAVLFPVYAFNAPGPVYAYIKAHVRTAGLPAAVISVSGGGEAFPNRASRLHTIRLLEKQGCRVVYEKMLMMPSNAIAPTPPDAACRLLEILPEKAEQIAGELLSGTMRRVNPGLFCRILTATGELEKVGAKLFGRAIRAADCCTGCGACADACPTGNIAMENGKPVFRGRCATCLRCIYDCPESALSPRFLKKLVLKEGFSLKRFEAVTAGFDETQNAQLKGVWRPLQAYLAEDDGASKTLR